MTAGKSKGNTASLRPLSWFKLQHLTNRLSLPLSPFDTPPFFCLPYRNKKYIDLIGMMILSLGMIVPILIGERRGEPKLAVIALDDSFYKTVLYAERSWDLGAHNDPNVTWAVFFHKPYCGACRRIRPMVHALAENTNFTQHLRFASLDCVRYRVFCQREGVDREPLIRLYKTTSVVGGKSKEQLAADKAAGRKRAPSNKKKWVRRKVADWQGMLVGYEVLKWFQQVQAQGILSEEIEWPENDVLSAAMHKFKTESKLHTGQVERVTTTSPKGDAAAQRTRADPMGYLLDIKSAMHLAFLDDVFGGHAKVLDGARLSTMVNWVETLSYTYPVKSDRARLAKLQAALVRKSAWRQKDFNGQVKLALGITREPPPVGTNGRHYNWCRSAGVGNGGGIDGVGGYPCGLWLLFHTMLANSDGQRAHLTLRIIYEWVQAFYGCVECAANFNEEWEEEGGTEVTGHIGTSLWLWRVHNMVRARLTTEDDSVDPKPQWPSMDQCEKCYVEEYRNDTSLLASGSLQTHTDFEPQIWDDQYVFAFLAETFCAGSDTFYCASFVDGE
jgi:thiol-disulfide isomerase/thioredoxin